MSVPPTTKVASHVVCMGVSLATKVASLAVLVVALMAGVVSPFVVGVSPTAEVSLAAVAPYGCSHYVSPSLGIAFKKQIIANGRPRGS